MNNLDTELSIMESIAADGSSGSLTQRDIASRSGLSLGMTNALLKRLAERGWVKLTRISTRTIRYALHPEGMAEIARRSAASFRRSASYAEVYRERLEDFVLAQLRKGVGTLILVGSSELDFLLEYVCERHGLVFVKSSDLEKAQALARKSGGTLLLAEKEAKASAPSGVAAMSLAQVLAGMNEAATAMQPDAR